MNFSEFLLSEKSKVDHYLLLGNPVAHSVSPLMHNTALDYYNINATYHAIRLQINELASLSAHFNSDKFLGANITIPYKQKIIPFLDELQKDAELVGAVNTISKHNYCLQGYNTDVNGFLAPLDPYIDELEGKRAIIFGSGGAARAVVAGLKRIGMNEIIVISRTPAKVTSFQEDYFLNVAGYSNWTAWAEDALLFVNATPLGMYPEVNQSPVRQEEISFLSGGICYDLVYNPSNTLFLKQGKKAGSIIINGLEMLIQQANRSFEIWTGKTFPLELIRKKVHERFKD